MRLPALALPTRALIEAGALAEARPLSRDDQRDGGGEQDDPDQAHPDRIGAWRPCAPRTFALLPVAAGRRRQRHAWGLHYVDDASSRREPGTLEFGTV